MLKSTVLLSIAIFLATAPQPDATDIARMSGSFIVVNDNTGLLAADDSWRFDRRADETQGDTAD